MNLAAKETIAPLPANNGLPEGWTWTTLGKAFQLNPPKPSAAQLSADSPVSFVPMPAVDAKAGVIAIPMQRPFGEVRSGFISFANDDVIMAKITPCMENGKAAIARDLVNGLGFGSTEFHVLRPNGTALPKYGYYFIRQAAFRSLAESEMTGSVGQKRVPADFLRQAMFPLPPLAEQHRIVAKLEQLLAAASTTRARLARVPILLKRFRQSVLAAACSGRLTADWREQNPDVEPAAKLLERILAERRAKWEAEQIAKKRGRAKVSGDDLFFTKEVLHAGGHLTFNERVPGLENEDFQLFSRPTGGVVSGYKEPSAPDISELPELPEEWEWASFQLLTKNYDGRRVPIKSTDRQKRRGRYDYYGASGVIDTIDDFLFDGEYLLVSEDGANLLARSTPIAFRANGKFWVNNHAHVVQSVSSMSLQYLEIVINGFDIQDYVTGSAQPKLTQDALNKISIPLPPLAEQQEIVRRVERSFRLVDAIEKRTAVATILVDRLTQAIFARAFRGELVPTEAELARIEGRDYEPASMLLEHALYRSK